MSPTRHSIPDPSQHVFGRFITSRLDVSDCLKTKGQKKKEKNLLEFSLITKEFFRFDMTFPSFFDLVTMKR